MAERFISDKILKDRSYEIAINPKYNGYQTGLASMLYISFLIRKHNQDQE